MRKTLPLHLLLALAGLIQLALLSRPALALTGDIYETNEDMILRMTPGNPTPITWAVGLSNPKGLVFDGTGKLYVADASRGSILRYAVPDGQGFTFASNLAAPVAVAFDPAGSLYVGEAGNGNITKFNVTDGTRTGYASGTGEPGGMVFATNGDLFVSNFAGGTIIRIAPDGTKTNFATGLNFPAGLAFDSSETLFAADSGSGIIYKFAADGSRTNFATGLDEPYGLVFEPTGNLVVSCHGNGSTYRFTPSGDRTTVFSSNFNTPQFVTVEPDTHALLNISTRGFVGTGDHYLIGGFNIGGVGPVGTTVIIRALGPSLSSSGIPDPLADPLLGVRDQNGVLIAYNDNWQNALPDQKIILAGLAPPNDAESGLQLTLRGGSYTAVVNSANGGTGVALVEVYNIQ